MFFFWAIISAFCYTLQSVLITKYSRKMDGISTCIYRSLSLGITMIPMLYWADFSKISQLPNHLPTILGAAALGVLSSATGFSSMEYLPIAISTSFRRIIGVIMAFLLSAIFFAETPTATQLILSAIVITGGVFLGIQKKSFAHINNNPKKGIFLASVAAISGALMFFLVAKASREFDPYVTGYLWETFIGIFALIFGFSREFLGGKKIIRIKSKTFFKILILATPTLLGTIGFVRASISGNFGILSAISTSSIFISLLLAHFLYHEKLSKKQIFWISVIVCGIIGLKIFG